jgi:hypothetical protein
MTARTCDCAHCPAFRLECEGCSEPCTYQTCAGECAACPVRCGRHTDLGTWLAGLGGLQLDTPLRPQATFRLAAFVPQLLNGLELAIPFQHLPDAAVATDKVLTAKGRVSKRALPHRPGPFSLRTQWRVSEGTRLICIGNCQDDFLESLWPLQGNGLWLQVRTLGFEFATGLNFSIYLDEPRMEHLISIKRSWLTIAHMQQTSTLIPIPHLQWGQLWDLERQLDYVRAQGFHTLTLNVQIAKRQAWATIAEGLHYLQEHAPDLHLLFTGVVSLKRLADLVRMFPTASFTSSTPHFLAQRHVQYQRDGTRLIKQPVDGHVDLILAENVRLYRDFLVSLDGDGSPTPRPPLPSEQALLTAYRDVAANLQARFGQSAVEATATALKLATDPAVLNACRAWLRSGELAPDFRGSFPTWPCAGPAYPSLGQLLEQGLDPLAAFLHLADLADRVDEDIQVCIGEAGY